MVYKMDLIRLFLATALLVFSSQSLALFMPEEFKISTDTTAGSDEGCGVIMTVLPGSTEY